MVASSSLTPRQKPYIIRVSPPIAMLLSCLICLVGGAGLLMLPHASHTGTGFMDALFTACSAITTTGVMVLDVGTHFTLFGQFIILALVQLGGLGLMAFAAMILMILGMHGSTTLNTKPKEQINQTDFLSLYGFVLEIFKFVLVLEVIGTVLLATKFVPLYGWGTGLWYSFFHAVSAFNNAGISLFSNGFTLWPSSLTINLVIPLLLLVGGAGYPVIRDLHAKRRWRTLELHSKIMLAGSAALVVWGTVFFAALEWSNPATLGRFDSDITKLLASWFQSTSARTAGFNTISMGGLTDSTSFMLMPLMVIGGGVSSTAGGIKVTTFIIMLLAIVAFFKQRDHLQIFGRSMGAETVLKAMAIIALSLFAVLCGLFLLMVTNPHLQFLDLAFEATGSFSTTGFSRGVTDQLNTMGRFVLMGLMCLGNFGPLAFSFFISTRMLTRVRYPASNVLLG